MPFTRRESIKVLMGPLWMAFSARLKFVASGVWSVNCLTSSTLMFPGGGSAPSSSENNPTGTALRGVRCPL